MNIILGVTGSVASVLMSRLRRELIISGNNVKVVVTEKSKSFISEDDLYSYYDDQSDFKNHYLIDNTIKHIELRDWADCMVIAPCSANTLAKISNGICDNLLTSIVRAWNFEKPIYIAPAMNTKMFNHPLTLSQLNIVEDWGMKIIYPTSNILACGDIGIGAMAHIKTITNIVNGHRWDLNRFDMNFLPLENHTGGFGSVRRGGYHTGVDIYMNPYNSVNSVEEGEVVSIGQFTGEAVGCGWWNDTWQITIRGKSGNICYGEIEVDDDLKVGDKIERSQYLGHVLKVLKIYPKIDVPYHNVFMVHMKLMGDDLIEVPDWEIGNKKHKSLLDPTPYLYLSTKRGERNAKERFRCLINYEI